MTVQELIEELQKIDDKQLPTFTHDSDDGYIEIVDVQEVDYSWQFPNLKRMVMIR